MYRFLLLAITLGASAAHAMDKAGTVVLSVGKNTAQTGQEEARLLKRKSPVFSSDTLSTGPNGLLQLRFTDGSRLSLKKDTHFKIEEYRFSEGQAEQGKSVYRLLKGGLRTITGAISDADKANYSINTPIATIGVRGTHYSLFFCDKTCNETTQAKIGLYGYVLEGTVAVDTDSISAPVQSGKFFFIGGQGSSLNIQKKPFALFEKLGDEGADLMGADSGSDIPALHDFRGPGFDSTRGQEYPPEY